MLGIHRKRKRRRQSDHPGWKVAQAIVSVIGLTVLVHHDIGGTHSTGAVDASDISGIVGGAFGLNLAKQYISNLFS